MSASASDTPERWLTTHEVCAAIAVPISARTIQRWAARGQLPCAVLPSGHRRYRLSDVAALLAQLEVTR